MLNPVFVVYDSKAGFYKYPVMLRSRGEALRMFADLANNPQSEICRFAEDFVLYYVADFDDEKGQYLSRKPECLGKAIEYKKVKENLNEKPKST